MRTGVLWDSSAILALLDTTDRCHSLAVKAVRGPLRKTVPFITNYIQMETHALVLGRVGRTVARQWLTQSGIMLVRATAEEESAGHQLVVEHTDKDWSLCDAVSFVVIEGRNARGAFTFDRHFRERGRFEIFGLPP